MNDFCLSITGLFFLWIAIVLIIAYRVFGLPSLLLKFAANHLIEYATQFNPQGIVGSRFDQEAGE